MAPPTLLVGHSRSEVPEALRSALGSGQVTWASDPTEAGERVTSQQFDAILIEHPFAGMDAQFLMGWLRELGASCPFLVVAEGITAAEVDDLAGTLGGERVLGSADASTVRSALDDVLGKAAAAPAPEPVAPAPDLPADRVDAWTPPDLAKTPDETYSLATKPVPDILLSLRHRAETGTVIFKTPAFTLRMDLSDGSPVRVRGGPPEIRIGQVFIRMGLLDKDGVQRLLAAYQAARAEEPAITMGDVALRNGWATHPQILEALTRQADERILAAQGLRQGEVSYYKDLRAALWEEIEARPVEALVAAGFRASGTRKDEVVEGFALSHGGQGIHVKPLATDLLPRFRFGAKIQRLLQVADGHSMDETLRSAPVPRDEALLCLYLLWLAGGIELGPPPVRLQPTSPLPAPRRETSSTSALRITHIPPVGVRVPPPTAPPAPPTASQEALARENREVVEEKLRLSAQAMARKDFFGARDLLRSAEKVAPSNPQVRAALGWTAFRLQPGLEQNRVEARALLQSAIDLDPAMAEAHLWLGKVLRVSGDLAKAKIHLEQALSIDMDNKDAREEIKSIDRLTKKDAPPPPPPDLDSTSKFLGLFFKKRR